MLTLVSQKPTGPPSPGQSGEAMRTATVMSTCPSCWHTHMSAESPFCSHVLAAGEELSWALIFSNLNPGQDIGKMAVGS